MADQETSAATEQASTAPSLTLQDLIQVANIIQVTSQRGAYRAEELADVGNLYNKLIAFLTSVGAISPQQNAEEN